MHNMDNVYYLSNPDPPTLSFLEGNRVLARKKIASQITGHLSEESGHINSKQFCFMRRCNITGHFHDLAGHLVTKTENVSAKAGQLASMLIVIRAQLQGRKLLDKIKLHAC